MSLRPRRFDELSCEERQRACIARLEPFDLLPKKVRLAAKNSKWGVTANDAWYFHDCLKSGNMTPSEVIQQIKAQERRDTEGMYRDGILLRGFGDGSTDGRNEVEKG